MFEKLARPVFLLSEVRSALRKVSRNAQLFGHDLRPEEVSVAHLCSPEENARSGACSFSRCVVPLSNSEVRGHYVNYLKQIRFGRILEDLDSFAVFVGYKHTGMIADNLDNVKAGGFSIVTALVDQIVKVRVIDPTKDLHLRGYVSWVGRSSMEVTMDLEQESSPEKIDKILTAHFVMVGIDAINKKPLPITPLAKPTDPAETPLFQLGQQNHQRRIEMNNQSLFRRPPDSEESQEIHNLYLTTLDSSRHSFQHRQKPSDTVWMDETSRKGLIICHPENRNIYGKIFGGYLMRTAYELAWAEAWTFSQTRPQCLAVDDIVFRRPVEVGSLLYLHQSIGVTDGNLVQSRVTASVSDVNDPTNVELANIFHFTFHCPLQVGRPALSKIIPRSYGESMLYLDSRRRLLSAKEKLSENGFEQEASEF